MKVLGVHWAFWKFAYHTTASSVGLKLGNWALGQVERHRAKAKTAHSEFVIAFQKENARP
jgi:hypothetical protein